MVALKLLQGAKIAKLLLFAGFFWSIALNHPLPFAIALTYAIVVHESGHLLAMKRCGMQTSGIWFIPFFGAAAVMKQGIRSASEEYFIAIAGPAFGLLSVIPLFAVALLLPGSRADNAAWFGYAATASLLNLFNLLPIGILDGGRIVKSLSSSLSRSLGLIVVGGGIVVCAVLVAWIGGPLLGVVLGLSIVELWRARNQPPPLPMSRGVVIVGTIAYAGLFAVLGILGMVALSFARGTSLF